jgi:gliding motility-associated protein GldM
MENLLLTDIRGEITTEDFIVDRMKPVVKPQSDFVVAGTKYNAEMFMVATASALQPQMEFNNTPIDVNTDGIGSLSFTASGGSYRPDGTVKKKWSGKIKIKNPSGKDTVYMVEHEYTVVKPVIQVQSASVQSLYRNCGNKLNIAVPALGASYHPTFKAEGGFVINGDKPGALTIVPTGAQVKIAVNNNGSFLGEEQFGVKLVPLPSIDVKVNGKKVPPLEGIPANVARTMTIRALPEINFAQALPGDANYFISEAVVTLARGKKFKDAIKYSGGQSISLAHWANKMESGDRLIIEVIKVKRKNFRNEMEEVTRFDRYVETIILN